MLLCASAIDVRAWSAGQVAPLFVPVLTLTAATCSRAEISAAMALDLLLAVGDELALARRQ